MEDGSQRWQSSRWYDLLPEAISILDAAEHDQWTFGGGTALAIWLDHRVSFDIDIFTRGSLIRLTSQFCEETKRVLGAAGKSQFPGHYLKLELADGEIDFLTPPTLTRDPTREMTFEEIFTQAGLQYAGTDGDRILNVELPTEILVRKILYRRHDFKPRDVFDLAAALEWSPDVLTPAVEVFKAQPDIIEQLEVRLRAMRPAYEAQAPLLISPRPGCEHLLSTAAIDLCLNEVNRLKPLVIEPELSPGQKPSLGPTPPI
ncbi:MAG: nucleotidyl transferase AbiEii/AbiGii toxin family protein [Acetobacter sp.]